MTYYDDIYERAVDENYLITTAEAREIGVPAIELAKLAHRGRLDYLGNGVYRLARFVPSATDPYAVGNRPPGFSTHQPGAHLRGHADTRSPDASRGPLRHQGAGRRRGNPL